MDNVEALLNAIGATAEMAHAFYKAMKIAGAAEAESLVGLGVFLFTTLTKSPGKPEEK